MFRIGIGNDTHRLSEGRPLMLGGVQIPSDLGAVGHSDADALLHAITDAILGALALGDIGSHFPDNDERWKGADSLTFLRHAAGMAKERGFSVVNVDSIINLESPKLRPYIDAMREKIAEALGVSTDRISIKAKTGEKVGPVGRREAISTEAIVLLAQKSQQPAAYS